MSFWYWIVAALFAVGLWFYWRAGGWKSCDIPPYPKNPPQARSGSPTKESGDKDHESKSPSGQEDEAGRH